MVKFSFGLGKKDDDKAEETTTSGQGDGGSTTNTDDTTTQPDPKQTDDPANTPLATAGEPVMITEDTEEASSPTEKVAFAEPAATPIINQELATADNLSPQTNDKGQTGEPVNPFATIMPDDPEGQNSPADVSSTTDSSVIQPPAENVAPIADVSAPATPLSEPASSPATATPAPEPISKQTPQPASEGVAAVTQPLVTPPQSPFSAPPVAPTTESEPDPALETAVETPDMPDTAKGIDITPEITTEQTNPTVDPVTVNPFAESRDNETADIPVKDTPETEQSTVAPIFGVGDDTTSDDSAATTSSNDPISTLASLQKQISDFITEHNQNIADYRKEITRNENLIKDEKKLIADKKREFENMVQDLENMISDFGTKQNTSQNHTDKENDHKNSQNPHKKHKKHKKQEPKNNE